MNGERMIVSRTFVRALTGERGVVGHAAERVSDGLLPSARCNHLKSIAAVCDNLYMSKKSSGELGIPSILLSTFELRRLKKSNIRLPRSGNIIVLHLRNEVAPEGDPGEAEEQESEFASLRSAREWPINVERQRLREHFLERAGKSSLTGVLELSDFTQEEVDRGQRATAELNRLEKERWTDTDDQPYLGTVPSNPNLWIKDRRALMHPEDPARLVGGPDDFISVEGSREAAEHSARISRLMRPQTSHYSA